ncbi:MAG: 50S ribosomal protein L11 methyltransferase [Lachnospiraceae bacterium]|nr:50S ribosomal protein L11 methyltransferase [Lachnospiraceae bacterium]
MEWKKYVLTTTTEAVELVSGVLMENGIDSFEIEDNKQISKEEKEAMYIDILPELTDDGIARIIFYMDMDVDKETEKSVIEGIKNGIEDLRMFVDVGEASIIESTTDELEWINKWKEFFKPFSVDDILIRPTWENVDNEKDYKMVIKIDPGTAFGTGLHETTQLCIRQLRKYITSDTNLLDVGCGSGILSIIGRKLGAKNVFGIDIDEAAVIASNENADENEVNDNIKFISGNIIDDKNVKDEVGYECYDIVVANILADVIMPLSKVIAPHMKVGGLFITSGIINTKEEQVKATIEANESFKILEITRQNDWVSITAERIK